MNYLCHNLIETAKIAHLFLDGLLQLPNRATVIGLKGDLGSGKTTFTQLVAEALGVKDQITSPTFVLMKSYKLKHSVFNKLIHIDAYRLNSGQDLLRLGWSEIIADPKNLILVEWPEIIEDIWQPEFKIINFEFIDEGTRKITF